MTERTLSELQKEYADFFRGKLNLYGVKSPAELKTKENKSKFFTEIKQDWAKVKFGKKQKKESEKKQIQKTTTEKEISKISIVKKTTTESETQNFKKSTQQDTESKSYGKRQEYQLPTQQEFSKQIIKSEPNQEQTDDLRILFTTNSHFEQTEQYFYPVVKMPKQNSNLKLPRLGRSNQKGYKENDFYNQIKSKITDINIDNNVHMVIPNYNVSAPPSPYFISNLNSRNLCFQI
jgi:hypothetical protein